MPRVDRNAAIGLVASWLTDLPDGRLSARPTASPHRDLEVTDSESGRTLPVKLAVREFSKSDREGKNFQVAADALRSASEGIVVLLYLNDEDLRRRGR